MDLTPDERFAIDPRPFRDADGTWYLFVPRDVLEGDLLLRRLVAGVPAARSAPSTTVSAPGGEDVMVYHAWTPAGPPVGMCLDPLVWPKAAPLGRPGNPPCCPGGPEASA